MISDLFRNVSYRVEIPGGREQRDKVGVNRKGLSLLN
jgi:hypothetical protein